MMLNRRHVLLGTIGLKCRHGHILNWMTVIIMQQFGVYEIEKYFFGVEEIWDSLVWGTMQEECTQILSNHYLKNLLCILLGVTNQYCLSHCQPLVINSGDGDLFMTGSNNYGQLGIGSWETQLLAARVSALDIYRITHVACGHAHTVAVTDLGALVSWRASEFGQLGLKDMAEVADVIQPHVVRGFQELHFVHVACGAAHTLALTASLSNCRIQEASMGS